MDDIAPKLLELIQQSYQNGISESELLAEITKLIASGKATYLDADQYAAEIGRILAEAYQANLSSAVLPDGKMYYNIAKRVIEPTMQEGYSAAAGVAQQVQQILNQAAGIGIKAIRPTLDPDKIAGILNRLSNAEDYDEVSWVLGEPVMKNFTQSVVTDSIRENAEYHGRAGLTPKVIRKSSGHCCDWCSKLAETYTYPDVPRDVYRRHKNCTCTVEYIPGDGKKQNVWTKGWSEEVTDEKLEARKMEVKAENEMQRRKIGSNGQQIIDKPTYRKLTRDFTKRGGIIIRGKDAENILGEYAYASYIAGGENIAFIRDEATISDVLEEMFHAEQDRTQRFGAVLTKEVLLKREIEAQEYLISVAEKYKIPVEEMNVTKKNLEYYKAELQRLQQGMEGG